MPIDEPDFLSTFQPFTAARLTNSQRVSYLNVFFFFFFLDFRIRTYYYYPLFQAFFFSAGIYPCYCIIQHFHHLFLSLFFLLHSTGEEKCQIQHHHARYRGPRENKKKESPNRKKRGLREKKKHKSSFFFTKEGLMRHDIQHRRIMTELGG